MATVSTLEKDRTEKIPIPHIPMPFLHRPPNILHKAMAALLLAVLAAAAARIPFALAGIPVALENGFVLLAGLLLGPWWGLASVGVYLLAGFLGLPVLPGGTGGIRWLLGASGGYLLGFVPAVVVTGSISRWQQRHWTRDVLAAVCGCAVIYVPGVVWLKLISRLPWGAAVSVGLLPFLAADAVKIAAAVSVSAGLRRLRGRGIPSQPA